MSWLVNFRRTVFPFGSSETETARFVRSTVVEPEYLDFEEYRYAVIAAEVYKATDLSEHGLPLANESQIELLFTDPEEAKRLLGDDKSGFRCRVYHDTRAAKLVLAFGGTVPAKMDDWINNFRQWSGLKAKQYERGIALASLIRHDLTNNVVVTGHSLGGGIATVSAVSRKLRAVVFNPPGIHNKTLGDFHLNLDHADVSIRRFVVAGDLLDLINRIPFKGIRLIGTRHDLYGSMKIPVVRTAALIFTMARILRHPALIASLSTLAPLVQKSIDLHSMNEVFYGLKKWCDRRKSQVPKIMP